MKYFCCSFGNYNIGGTPLAIPNREVKTNYADGTVKNGRVGSCQPIKELCGV